MSERILEALMRLFAIFARPDSDASDRRPVVEMFLKHQLNKELVQDFLVIYDKEYDDVVTDINRVKEQAKSKDQERLRMRIISKLSTRILKISQSINEELTQKQKIFVLVRILEFIKTAAQEVTDQELEQEKEFIDTLVGELNLNKDEFKTLQQFVSSDFDRIPSNQHLLLIDNNKDFQDSEVKHIYSEFFSGQIKVINIPSVNTQMFRSHKVGELNINGQLVQEDIVNFLSIGSAIRSSKIKPIYYSQILSAYNVDKRQGRIVFETKDVVYKFKGGNVGLHKMNFREESGHLVGIMGASGAGKSTLLNVLNSTYKPTEGTVTINGVDIHNDEEGKLKGLIGYVSQDDLLIEELTVFQNLYYNAKLCFDNYTEEQLVEAVDNVLKSLGLFERKDMIVGNPLNKKISGGQRKRLNIALELIREPAILFLDEPTSGLSSKDSENIMDLLKELSLKGKLVFVVIHQPSSDIFKTFDKLIILDTGGYQIYYGDPVDSIIYFKERMHQADWNESECPTCGNVNPEQVFKIIEANVIDEYGNLTPTRKFSPHDWYDMYTEHQEKEWGEMDDDSDDAQIPEISFKIPNWFRQFKVFVKRDVLAKLYNMQYIMINALESPIIAVFLAYIIKYWNVDVNNELGYVLSDNDNLPVYIFMTVICAIFVGLTVSAEEIISDKRILKRESFLNLSRSSYLMSKIAILLVISAIQAFTFIIIGNTILEIKGMYLEYWLIAFSTWTFANMMGLNISDSFKTAVTIYILIPFLVIPQIILSGIIVKFDKLNPTISNPKDIPLYGEIMTSRWAYEALAVKQFKDNEYEKLFYKWEKAMSQADYIKNYWVKTIRNKLNAANRNIGKEDRLDKVEYDLKVVHNEIRDELKRSNKIPFEHLDELNAEHFTEATYNATLDFLAEIKQYNVKRYNFASNKKDEIINNLQKTPELKEQFVMLKKMHYNENLAEFCRNSNEIERIIEYNHKLYQKIDPIFQDPEHPLIRAHFYAPQKRLFNTWIDTFWANLLIIWLMSITLYITLYFKALKRLLDFFERMSDKFKKEK